MRFSAPVKKHWLGSFSIVLPPSGLRGFVPVVRAAGSRGHPGPGPGTGGGGGIREHVLHVFSAQSDSCAITFSTDALRLPVSMQSDEVQTIECFSQLLLVALIRAPPRTEPVCVVEVDNRFRAREVSGGDARNKLQITAPAKHKPPKKQP